MGNQPNDARISNQPCCAQHESIAACNNQRSCRRMKDGCRSALRMQQVYSTPPNSNPVCSCGHYPSVGNHLSTTGPHAQQQFSTTQHAAEHLRSKTQNQRMSLIAACTAQQYRNWPWRLPHCTPTAQANTQSAMAPGCLLVTMACPDHDSTGDGASLDTQAHNGWHRSGLGCNQYVHAEEKIHTMNAKTSFGPRLTTGPVSSY